MRDEFEATFVRFGKKSGYRGEITTILFKDIKLDGKIVTDHLWFRAGKWSELLNSMPTDTQVKFNARVTQYEKGYKGYREDVYKPIEIDYRLSYPTKLCLI